MDFNGVSALRLALRMQKSAGVVGGLPPAGKLPRLAGYRPFVPALWIITLCAQVLDSRAWGQSEAVVNPAALSVAEAAFQASLVRDCLVWRDGKLVPVTSDFFDRTRLFVIYYKHLTRSRCVPVKKQLNAWLDSGKAPGGADSFPEERLFR